MTVTDAFDRWVILQVRVDDREVESVIAKFQHKQIAEQFLSAIQPVTGHYLILEEIDER